MTIRYEPKKVLQRLMKKKLLDKLVTRELTINRAVLQTLAQMGILSNKTLERIALKVLREYKKKFKKEVTSGETIKKSKEQAVNDNKLMIQRVQNASIFEVSKTIESDYRGEFYTWLPSEANEPDPEHQLRYGKTYQIGKGEMPGERYGCKCGMDILVKEKRLKL